MLSAFIPWKELKKLCYTAHLKKNLNTHQKKAIWNTWVDDFENSIQRPIYWIFTLNKKFVWEPNKKSTLFQHRINYNKNNSIKETFKKKRKPIQKTPCYCILYSIYLSFNFLSLKKKKWNTVTQKKCKNFQLHSRRWIKY